MPTNKKKNKSCLSALFGFGSNEPVTADNLAISSSDASIEPDVKEPLPFRLRDDFLSNSEHSFYLVIKSMMGTYFTICPKVSMSDIFYVIKPNENVSFYNKINRKHVDFLICDTETMKPRFAIELDDKSHNRHDRMERDEFVEELFETANLPLVRIPVRPTYNTNELGILFREAVRKGQHSTTTINANNTPVETITDTKTAPYCPKCGQQMVLRTSQNGANKGGNFYGCVNYPKCKMVIQIE
jgi:predicted RNA-binding Zn-ribbon protein involved in translation (DUF1610 family)